MRQEGKTLRKVSFSGLFDIDIQGSLKFIQIMSFFEATEMKAVEQHFFGNCFK